MRFSPPDETIELYKVGFNNDLLGREKISKRLSDIVERIEDPLVIALDGRWGTGKSHFLQRWVGAHSLQNDGKAQTVYFDAFAHDYLSDPLIALVGALSERLPKENATKLNKVKSVALKLWKPAARIGLAVSTAGATEVLGTVGDAAAQAFGNEAEKAANAFWQREEGRHAAMEEFRDAIKALTQAEEGEDPTPLIIVIDELDRCRPDYALEILEVIKHFFAVPHVHFILGVNLNALENSVKARYGPEIDATAYLQKFLSFTLNLPDHIGDHGRTLSTIKYANHLGRAMEIPRHILDETRHQLEILSRNNAISIRDVGKIMSTASLLPEQARNNQNNAGQIIVMVSLIIAKIIKPNVHRKMLNASLTDNDLFAYVGVNSESIASDTSVDHYSKILYLVWSFIRRDGILVDEIDQSSISNMFFRYGGPRKVKQIPIEIYDDWLSDFNLS